MVGKTPKAQHAEGVWKRSQLNRAKGVKGKISPCKVKGQRPLWGLGQRPTVPRATSMPNALNKGAGSEASLPVTLRSRRSAPKLLFPTSVLCRAGWARPNSWSCDHSCPFPKAGDFASAEATRGLSDRPLDPFGLHISILDFSCGRTDLIRPRFAQPPSPEGKARRRVFPAFPLGEVVAAATDEVAHRKSRPHLRRS